MAKKKNTPARRTTEKPSKAIAVQSQFLNSMGISNGLTEAIMGYNPGGMGTQVVQTETVFKNLRWYLISNMRQVLSQVYAERGLVQTVIDVPVDDGLRGGFQIKTKMISPEQVEELRAEYMAEQINSEVVGQALKWNRLFGGAGIITMTDQDPSEPLNIDAIRSDSPLEFRPVDMWELFYDKQNTETYDRTLQFYDPEYYSYYGIKLHKSRVRVMKGITPPSFIRPRLRGWGLSVIEALVASINQYLKNNELAFEVLDEFKIDIFKIKNLTQTLLSADGTNQVQRRVALANAQKNFQHALTMDSEDDYAQKQLAFTGLAEMMKEFRIQIASDMRMPITKLFGISASGFNSGEDDIEVYNGMVEGQVRNRSYHHIIEILKLKAKKKFGVIPEDISIEFDSLRVLSTEQMEKVKDSRMNRVVMALDKGLCTLKEAKESVNKYDLVGVQVDTSIDTLPLRSEPDGDPNAKESEEEDEDLDQDQDEQEVE